MTERLSQLLHDEADRLDVPPVPADSALSRGRRMRRRRTGATVGAAAMVLAVIAGGALVVTGRDDDRGIDPSAAMAAYQRDGAFAVGRDLYVGDTHVRWRDSIKAIYYSSAGVMIRSGDSSDTNEGASAYTLVTPTGDTSDVDVSMGNRIPGFEPDSPHFAYASAREDGDVDVVVHDVESDEELARVTVDGSRGWGGWEAPPVAIDGDVAWVRFSGAVTEVDWRTGAVREVPGTDAVYEIANGRYVDWRGQRWVVRSMSDGSVVRELDLAKDFYGFFSPDGRYLRAFDNMGFEPEPFYYAIFDVQTGNSRTIEEIDAGEDMGWTPDGRLLRVDGDTVSVCEPLTDTCASKEFDRGEGTPKLGGNPYES